MECAQSWSCVIQLLSGLQLALLKQQVTEMTLGEMILQMSVENVYFFQDGSILLSHIFWGVFAPWLGLWERAYYLTSSAGGDHVDWAFVTIFLCCGE